MYDDERGRNRQLDLVLSANEFCFVQNQTNGSIRTYVGPTTVTISQQESLVLFNEKTKRFEQIGHDRAKQLFITAPEGWYVTLKNPTTDWQFPEGGAANNTPETIKIGVKINIAGPFSFALFPGQMARVIQGHKLRSNQYLLARVYDAEALKTNKAKTVASDSNTITNPDDAEVAENGPQYETGQLLVIKGTEVSFYMPPTGIEIIPNEDGSYVREAVTLERLNYAILKNEDGEKRYVHGPVVVFPKPTETFVANTDGSPIFRAMELSPISGIYVKVIAPYEEHGVRHELGEELFITGDDSGQKIYYPRPEHTIISYGDKIMHHAIAVPAGEGRYVLNRMTGEIETIRGPLMFLPDPRKQVIVKRILTDAECGLIYPGNQAVVNYNHQLRKDSEVEYAGTTQFPKGTEASVAHKAIAGIQRRTSFTKPRTITLDTKFEGAVSIDVWTGYAINVVSKTGERQVVVGPTTRLLDYDETVEALQLSTGKPKTTDQLETVAFLRIDNNKISDIIEAQTKDFVSVEIKVSYVVDFLRDYQDKWFSVENYVKFLCDHERTAIKKAVKNYTIQELYAELIEIVTRAVLGDSSSETDDSTQPTTSNDPVEAEVPADIAPDNDSCGHLFAENGMFVKDVEVLSLKMDPAVERIITEHQLSMVRESLDLADAEGHLELRRRIAEAKMQETSLQARTKMLEIELENDRVQRSIEIKREQDAKTAEANQAEARAQKALQPILDAIHQAELARDDAKYLQEVRHRNEDVETEKALQENFAAMVEKILAAIQPDLVAALTTKANAEMITEVAQNIAPWAIAQGEPVSETINRLLRGTSLEHVIENLQAMKSDED